MVLKSGLGSQLHLFLKSSKSRAHTIPPPKLRSFINSAFSLICLASSKLTHWSPLNAYGPIRRFLSWTTVQPFFNVLSQICNCPGIKDIYKNLRRKVRKWKMENTYFVIGKKASGSCCFSGFTTAISWRIQSSLCSLS